MSPVLVTLDRVIAGEWREREEGKGRGEVGKQEKRKGTRVILDRVIAGK